MCVFFLNMCLNHEMCLWVNDVDVDRISPGKAEDKPCPELDRHCIAGFAVVLRGVTLAPETRAT